MDGSPRALLLLAVVCALASAAPGIHDLTNDAAGYHVNPSAIFETSLGEFEAEIYLDVMPLTASNFIDLAEKGFFDGLHFHRIIPKFMIQTGCPFSRDPDSGRAGTGNPDPGSMFQNLATGETLTRDANGNIPDEHVVKLSNEPGTLSMANIGQPDTGGSQFFINVRHNSLLDWFKEGDAKHAVFGKVTKGMDVVKEISKAKRDRGDKPIKPILITKVHISPPFLMSSEEVHRKHTEALAKGESWPRDPPQMDECEGVLGPLDDLEGPGSLVDSINPDGSKQSNKLRGSSTEYSQVSSSSSSEYTDEVLDGNGKPIQIDGDGPSRWRIGNGMPEEATSQPPRADYIRGGGGQKEADEKGWNPFGKKALANKGAAAATTDEWYAKWQQRLGCWWVMQPSEIQKQLGHCRDALALHITSRFDAAIKQAHRTYNFGVEYDPGSARYNPTTAAAALAEQPGCEGISKRAKDLQLPAFPAFEGIRESFKRAPTPRLVLPNWQRPAFMQSQADEQLQSLGVEQAESRADSMVVFTTAAGMGFAGATSITLVLCLVQRRLGRPQLRSMSSAAGELKRARLST